VVFDGWNWLNKHVFIQFFIQKNQSQ